MINDYQKSKCSCTGASAMSRMYAQDYGVEAAKSLAPYENPRLKEMSLDYDGFLCASVNQLTGTVNGHETGVDIDMSGYSLCSEWEGFNNE